MPNTSHPLQAMESTCKDIAEVKVGETHKLASKLWDLSIGYFTEVRKQAHLSFFSALGAAIVGTIFYFLALYWMMHGQVPFSKLSLIAGTMIQVISAINFYLYARTSRKFSEFHVCLERANRFLLANTICENLEEPHKDEMRRELIRTIANAPLLSFDLVEHGVAKVESVQDKLPEQEESKVTLPSTPQPEGIEGEQKKAL